MYYILRLVMIEFNTDLCGVKISVTNEKYSYCPKFYKKQ